MRARTHPGLLGVARARMYATRYGPRTVLGQHRRFSSRVSGPGTGAFARSILEAPSIYVRLWQCRLI